MSDGLPTEEQLRRIERGVQRRIDLRRAVARRVAGTTAAVALLGGGFALLVPLALGSASSGGSTSSGAGSAAGGSAAGSSALQEVVCHDSSARGSAGVRRKAPTGASDERLIQACGEAVDFQSQSGRLSTATPAPSSGRSAADGPAAASTPAASASPAAGSAVLCVASDGVLHVFPADARPSTLCARDGMRAR